MQNLPQTWNKSIKPWYGPWQQNWVIFPKSSFAKSIILHICELNIKKQDAPQADQHFKLPNHNFIQHTRFTFMERLQIGNLATLQLKKWAYFSQLVIKNPHVSFFGTCPLSDFLSRWMSYSLTLNIWRLTYITQLVQICTNFKNSPEDSLMTESSWRNSALLLAQSFLIRKNYANYSERLLVVPKAPTLMFDWVLNTLLYLVWFAKKIVAGSYIYIYKWWCS